ncbi:hypothetical protein MbovWib_02960 [Mycoplasmopsis bovis]
MDKKFRILASLLTPILATPVIAATCKSKKEEDKNNEKNQKNKLMTPQDQGSLNQQDKNEKTDNNQNSESLVNPNETNNEEEKKKIEEEKKLKEKQEQEDKKKFWGHKRYCKSPRRRICYFSLTTRLSRSNQCLC